VRIPRPKHEDQELTQDPSQPSFKLFQQVKVNSSQRLQNLFKLQNFGPCNFCSFTHVTETRADFAHVADFLSLTLTLSPSTLILLLDSIDFVSLLGTEIELD